MCDRQMINPYNPFSNPATMMALYEPFLSFPTAMPKGKPEGDQFERQNTKGEEGKKRPWYVTFLKESVLSGLTITASIAGGVFGGPLGAIAAGSLTSSLLGIMDQKLFEKAEKIDWGSVGIDAVLGAIPGTVAESIVKSGCKALERKTGKVIALGAKNSVKRNMIIGASDGVLIGSVGGFAHSAYDSQKEEGKVRWGQAFKDSFKTMIPAIFGGALGAGAFAKAHSYYRSKRGTG